MPSFKFDIGEKESVGLRFLSDVRDELQRALSVEKSERKITQQQIANLLGTSRAVINRQLMGLENIGIKRVGEILWAIGWEPLFQARKVPAGHNQFVIPKPTPTTQTKSELTIPINNVDRYLSLKTEARAAA